MVPPEPLLTIKNETVDPNDKPSDVSLSKSTEVIIKNYTNSNVNSQRLKSLQKWVQEQKSIYNK